MWTLWQMSWPKLSERGWTIQRSAWGAATMAKFTSGWWFETIFIFPYIANNNPNWLIFFRGVETTNQSSFEAVSLVTCRQLWEILSIILLILEGVLQPAAILWPTACSALSTQLHFSLWPWRDVCFPGSIVVLYNEPVWPVCCIWISPGFYVLVCLGLESFFLLSSRYWFATRSDLTPTVRELGRLGRLGRLSVNVGSWCSDKRSDNPISAASDWGPESLAEGNSGEKTGDADARRYTDQLWKLIPVDTSCFFHFRHFWFTGHHNSQSCELLRLRFSISQLWKFAVWG